MAHWIKFELATLDKPEVIRIGRTLGLSREAVVGHLIRFWGWFGDNSVDGHVDAVVVADVDMVLSLPGFADAMIAVNWLEFDVDHQRLIMPNFDRHNGESSKKRALKAGRQARYREPKVDACVDGDVDAQPSTKVPPDKIRVDKSTTSAVRAPAALKTLTDLGVAEQHAKDWLAVRKAKRAPLTDTALQSLHQQASKAGISVAKAVEICAQKNWQGFNADWEWGAAPKTGGLAL